MPQNNEHHNVENDLCCFHLYHLPWHILYLCRFKMCVFKIMSFHCAFCVNLVQNAECLCYLYISNDCDNKSVHFMHSFRNIQIKTKQNVSAENEEQPEKKNNKKNAAKNKYICYRVWCKHAVTLYARRPKVVAARERILFRLNETHEQLQNTKAQRTTQEQQKFYIMF